MSSFVIISLMGFFQEIIKTYISFSLKSLTKREHRGLYHLFWGKDFKENEREFLKKRFHQKNRIDDNKWVMVRNPTFFSGCQPEKNQGCQNLTFFRVWNKPWFLKSNIRVQIKLPIVCILGNHMSTSTMSTRHVYPLTYECPRLWCIMIIF